MPWRRAGHPGEVRLKNTDASTPRNDPTVADQATDLFRLHIFDRSAERCSRSRHWQVAVQDLLKYWFPHRDVVAAYDGIVPGLY